MHSPINTFALTADTSSLRLLKMAGQHILNRLMLRVTLWQQVSQLIHRAIQITNMAHNFLYLMVISSNLTTPVKWSLIRLPCFNKPYHQLTKSLFPKLLWLALLCFRSRMTTMEAIKAQCFLVKSPTAKGLEETNAFTLFRIWSAFKIRYAPARDNCAQRTKQSKFYE